MAAKYDERRTLRPDQRGLLARGAATVPEFRQKSDGRVLAAFGQGTLGALEGPYVRGQKWDGLSPGWRTGDQPTRDGRRQQLHPLTGQRAGGQHRRTIVRGRVAPGEVRLIANQD